MKRPQDKGRYRSMKVPRICDICKKERQTTRFGWKFHDFHKTYSNSGLRIIHGENYDLCEPCLKKINSQLNNLFK